VPIYGDRKQECYWLHVTDHCRPILAVLERGRIGEVYDIGGPDVVENLSMARRVLRGTGKPDSLLSCVRDRPGYGRRYGLTCEKRERERGWKPSISLDEGLRETIEWYRTNSVWMAGVRDGEYLSYYEKDYENRGPSAQAAAESGQKSPDG
jgi:dTDP-glucose 4,6-dehydratase